MMEGLVLRSFSYVSRAGICLLFRNSDRLVGTFHRRRSSLLKTGSLRHVMELKIQRKNPGNKVLRKLKEKTAPEPPVLSHGR
jgi:hypothetical protein